MVAGNIDLASLKMCSDNTHEAYGQFSLSLILYPGHIFVVGGRSELF